MQTVFTPEKFSKKSGNMALPAASFIVLPEDAGFPLKARAAAIAAELSRKAPSRLTTTCGVIADKFAFLRCVRNGKCAAQGYRLNTAKTPAVLEASTDAGFFYGLMEVAELVAANRGLCPKCEIIDAPVLARRGYMLDVSRGKIPTMETLKSLIESLSRLRYNEFELYMEHPFTFTADEDVWYDTGAFSPAQIQELDAFCLEHFIKLIPNFNCFGHLTKWFGAERYKDLAECEDGWYFEPWDCKMHSVMSPGAEANEFLERHLAELLPNFTADECNIGFDETFELGHGKSEKLCKKIGQGKLFFKHLQTVADIIAKYGKKPQIWGDMAVTHPELLDMLPKSITPIVWKYEQADEFEADCVLFHKNGF
ncbi:MAG: beta-N-acetylhexosaminidase, partial [Lentisphaeria bacterium]|nr:beta-N-acetylhexosaminidase [Lentisphaeria bacterium]